MSSKARTWLRLWISLALIAGTIWFLFNHQNSFWYGNARWIIPHHMMAGGTGMGIIMIIFWVVVIAAIAMLVSGIFSGRQSSDNAELPKPPDALEILKIRYAKGEIDLAQYQAMKRELQQS